MSTFGLSGILAALAISSSSHCLNMADVRDAAAMYVDAFYELDLYLNQLRVKDFI